MIYHPFVTRVVPNMVMRRERMLPVRGDVYVEAGARVEPSDIIASASLPSVAHLLNVARALSLNDEELASSLRVSVGDLVAEGDVLAVGGGPSRLFSRSYRSPVKGVLAAISNGRLIVLSSRTTVELEAHYKGTVMNVMSALGAIIEMNGALIQGVWGSGKEGFGVLKVIVSDPAQSIDPEAIDVTCRGTVLVVGASVGEEALYRAQEMDVKAMVVGGLDAGLRELASSMPFPVVVTEGMGKFTISAPIFDVLKLHEGQEVSVRGTVQARGGAVRPEVVIYVPQVTGEPVAESRPEFRLQEGSEVRIVRGTRLGKTGRVVGFPSDALEVETGSSLKSVALRIEGGEEVLAVRANVELFG